MSQIIVVSLLLACVVLLPILYNRLEKNKNRSTQIFRVTWHNFVDRIPTMEEFLAEIRQYEFSGILNMRFLMEEQTVYLTIKNGSVGIVSNSCMTTTDLSYSIFITNVTTLIQKIESACGDETSILRILNSIACINGTRTDELYIALAIIGYTGEI